MNGGDFWASLKTWAEKEKAELKAVEPRGA